jgi:hypothetical protein
VLKSDGKIRVLSRVTDLRYRVMVKCCQDSKSLLCYRVTVIVSYRKLLLCYSNGHGVHSRV